jgi:DNA replicative helicase MCM subunit Mcm2 (Cdc46/Mcm family)
LGHSLLDDPVRILKDISDCLVSVQNRLIQETHPVLNERFSVKNSIEIRFNGLPLVDNVVYNRIPTLLAQGKLMMVTGTVIRTSAPRMIETEAEFECIRCKKTFVMKADHAQYGIVPKPAVCDALIDGQSCNSVKFNKTFSSNISGCEDYQEIRLQESSSSLDIGAVPRTLSVILTADLVDACRPGDTVSLVGWLDSRWKAVKVGLKAELECYFFANNISVNNRHYIDPDTAIDFAAHIRDFWSNYNANRLEGRNIIVNSFCTQIYGMFLPKLAVLLTLIGGCLADEDEINENRTGARSHRREGHILLVGDPGTAKSQLLTYAARISPRAVVTTGSGSTNAGLTVTAVKEGTGWTLEAGALVLADRGICCIDEFNSLRPNDRTAIHEAMEQQTLSVAKAGLVCKLNTRCSIIAACNSKGKFEEGESISSNTALASPLLSRFDLILVLLDRRSEEWDLQLSGAILDAACNSTRRATQVDVSLWDLEMLKSYINFTKHQGRPIMGDEARLIISRYYQMQRGGGSRDAARTTVRLLEGLIRLAQAHAKLLFQTEILPHDALAAIILMESSLQTQSILGIKPDLYDGAPEDPMKQWQDQKRNLYEKLKINTSVFQKNDMQIDADLQAEVDEILCSWAPTQYR